MSPAQPLPDMARHDVRMDGVYFVRAFAEGAFAKALEAGNFSYCVMVRAGRLCLESDFPTPLSIDLGPGDAVAVSGLNPHVFRSLGAPANAVGAFERLPMTEIAPPREVELVLGVAPNESLALGSLMLGPILVRKAEEPELSRRLWGAVAMLEDEYADASWIDHNLIIRRLAEIMAVNFSRRVFSARRAEGAATEAAPASRPILMAINAFLRAPERPWSLEELARAAGMSRTRFAEEFKAVTGQTPGHIVARMRLTAIAQRLASAPLSIEAAAEEAGYSSAAAFVRAFHRAFGETPARWRRGRAAREAPPPRPRQRGRTSRRPGAHRHEKDAS